MVIVRFPPVSQADPRGLLAIGGDLEPESLLLAYSSGIFPWPFDEDTLAWYAPPRRAVLFLEKFHVQRRLARVLKTAPFTCVMDRDFRGVIERCSELENRGDQNGTWITSEIIEGYHRLHLKGLAHSFEAYTGEELVGGMYGVRLGNYFSAESSFFRVSYASKAAMCFMVDYLRNEGIAWFDCQALSSFSESFGAEEIPRARFMKMLKEALRTEGSPVRNNLDLAKDGDKPR